MKVDSIFFRMMYGFMDTGAKEIVETGLRKKKFIR